MKLMNEVESEVSGSIVNCLVENGQPVEFGERLFAVRPKK
jgi:oxaloacetate decarboxylase alpha subunit